MDQIKVKTYLSSLRKGGQACYQLKVKDQKTMTQDEFVRKLAEALNVSLAKARLINDVHGQVLSSAIVQNRIVNTGSLRGYLSIGGSLPSASADVSPLTNPMHAVLNATGNLKDAVADVTPVNDTPVVEAALYTVQYGTSDLLNTIEGTGVVKINGKGLLINAANADEGIWLETLAGIVATDPATIVSNDENTLDVSFAELPETTGGDQFRLVISTRNGNSKDDYGVVRLERIVRIIPANR